MMMYGDTTSFYQCVLILLLLLLYKGSEIKYVMDYVVYYQIQKNLEKKSINTI